MSEEIIKVLDELGKKFGVAVDWTQQNVMPYAQDLGNRIVKYEIYSSIVWMIIGTIAILISGLFYYLSIKRKWNKDTVDWFSFLFFIVCCVSIIVIIIPQIFDIVKCITIPETMWIDYIKQYLN